MSWELLIIGLVVTLAVLGTVVGLARSSGKVKHENKALLLAARKAKAAGEVAGKVWAVGLDLVRRKLPDDSDRNS